jgi:DNA-binding SARP family transcriptional activator/tetratricopeptide (TPR) repeat protein
MEFRVLGPLEVRRSDRPLHLGGSKQRGLLALLLLHGGKPLSPERLIDGLWGERPPATAAKALQVYVSQLRKLLEPGRAAGSPGRLLISSASGYALRIEDGELDLQRFMDLREQAQQALADGRTAEAARLLREALALWRGPALADVADEPFAQIEAARLEELRLAATEERIEADLRLGRHSELVAELDALVAEQPLRESLHARHMLALYRSGRQAEALDNYQQTRRTLVEELGIEPGRALRELHQAMLRQDPALDPPATPGSTGGPARAGFVGRDDELAELADGLDDAYGGRGRLFLLAGEPGIGKSRLAEELITHARRRGARVLVGRCWEAGGAPAYWPWVQSLRACVREIDDSELRSQLGAGAADIAQLVPELRQRFPELPEPSSLELEGARFRLFDATAEFLRNAAARRPIVLVLDDLHAGDAPSLLLLQFVARELQSMRLLILGAFRDVDPVPHQPLTAMLTELTREPLARRLSLSGLQEHEIAEYVDATAGSLASPQLIQALHKETEGNPLFIGEIVRLLSVEGVKATPGRDIRLVIPQTVRDVIARRLSHLSDACDRILVVASVLGREFALDALAGASGLTDRALLDTLGEAIAAGIVSDVGAVPSRFRFAHVLIRDTLYEGLTTAGRVRLHREAMVALESLYSDEPGPHLAELAHHAVAGSDFDKAVTYARRAGERSLDLFGYEEAARLFETALEALELASPRDATARCELLLSLGEAEARAGSRAAKRTFGEAADLAQRLGLSHELARAAAGYGGRLAWARAASDERLVPLLEAGLGAVGDDVELRARLLARLAGALRDEHARDRRDALSKKAVELARRTGNSAALAYALEGRVCAIIAPDTLDECIALASELCEVAEQIQDRERLVIGHDMSMTSQSMIGAVADAEAHQKAASRIAKELRQPAQLWLAISTDAAFALAAGRLQEAERLAGEAFALGQDAQPEMAIPVFRVQQYTLSDFHGRLQEVEATISDLVSDYPSRPVFRCVLAHTHARLGRHTEAKQALDELTKDDCAALPFDQEWLLGMSLLAETSALLGDEASAPILYELLSPWAAYNAADPAEAIRGSVSRYLGLLAATIKRWAEAEKHFEDALTMNRRMSTLPWLAQTQEDYARMLLARGKADDRSHAEKLLDEALAAYRELGMESYAGSASADISA